jgi:hypothetical protein
MKILFYYFAILVPIPFLIWVAINKESLLFVLFLFLYAIIYRPILDGYRLFKKGIIKKTEFWKVFIPFWRLKYFKNLYYLK